MPRAPVSDEIEITDAEGEVRRIALGAAVTTFGSDPACELHYPGAGIAPRHLRFVRTARGMRVEPVAAGGAVEINGEPRFAKELEPGDEIAVGAVRLRWRGARTAARPVLRPAVRPAARGGSAAAAPRRPRHRSMPSWLLVSTALLLSVGGIALLLKALAASDWPHSPQDYVDLARAQFGSHDPQRALDTLEFALRDATGPVRDQALKLQADIRQLLVERSEQGKVDAARQQHDSLTGFEATFLMSEVTRPKAREFVRQCDQWLAQHAELGRRHRDALPLLAWVESARARHAAAAALGEPETAADVLFAAQAHLRFQWREYPAAIARLDAFLARTPDAAVQGERDRLLADGEKWLQGKLRQIDNLLARGDRDNAARDLLALERFSVLPAWEPQLRERKARL
ncbi:MAG: hypothetical protein JNL08_11480 [Planctomycetes bacterium]|nr:hypothetical protein [Planctomycetota bacterium]